MISPKIRYFPKIRFRQVAYRDRFLWIALTSQHVLEAPKSAS
jgi:hypothetical protein